MYEEEKWALKDVLPPSEVYLPWSECSVSVSVLSNLAFEYTHVLAPHIPQLIVSAVLEMDSNNSRVCEYSARLLANLLQTHVLSQNIDNEEVRKTIYHLNRSEYPPFWKSEEITKNNLSVKSSGRLASFVRRIVNLIKEATGEDYSHPVALAALNFSRSLLSR